MVVTGALGGPMSSVSYGRSFIDMVAQSPQPLPEVMIPLHTPKMVDGDLCMVFSKEEIALSAQPFKFSMVMKFLQRRPYLDIIKSFIRNCWGLANQHVVSSMRKPRMFSFGLLMKRIS